MSFLAALLASALCTGLVWHQAARLGLLDVPNARSSHTRVTPRGGGLAIVLVVLGAVALEHRAGRVGLPAFAALCGGGLLVAAVGFLDDLSHVAAWKRFLVHLAAATWAVGWLGGLPALPIGTAVIDLGWPGDALLVVGIVWLINAFNFMDGIDGIAAVETLGVSGGAALLAFLLGAPREIAPLLYVAAAAAGFLAWNLPPARIFMGDVGSGFLGFLLGALALHGAAGGPLPVWSWLILLGVFLVDATVTLLRRMLGGERWYDAHRSHAYQKLARRWRGHRRVTLAVLGVNTCWLLPLAGLAAWRPGLGLALLLLAWLPLVGIALALRAGVAAGD